MNEKRNNTLARVIILTCLSIIFLVVFFNEIKPQKKEFSEWVKITKIQTVCHEQRRHVAMYYTDDEGEHWMILTLPSAHSPGGSVFAEECNGSEQEHPQYSWNPSK